MFGKFKLASALVFAMSAPVPGRCRGCSDRHSVEALSYGPTGKVQKMELRRRFAGHYSSGITALKSEPAS